MNNMTSYKVETFSFIEFRNSYEEISAFCVFTQSTNSDPWDLSDNVKQTVLENDQINLLNQLIPIFKKGHSLAIKSTVVYLCAIIEAYCTGVINELVDRRIKDINHKLIGSPVPTNEDEDISIEIQLEEQSDNINNPFHMFAENTLKYFEHKTYNQSVENSIKLLNKYFGVVVENKDTHMQKWRIFKELRNNIIHHRGYTKDKFSILKSKMGNELDKTLISSSELNVMMDDMFQFVYAIELGIFNTFHKE